tara:strand:+ start:1491 stop:1904 length:414 start_codon:yes stop_codon:yes gene_type:complete
MAWGSKELEIRLVAENAAQLKEIEMLREKIGDLKEDKADLTAQLRHTQEALICKEAPEVYRDKKQAVEERELAEPDSEAAMEAFKKKEQHTAIQNRFIQELEEPLFLDADDMISNLTKAVGAPILSDSKSLHNNDES